MKKITILGSTGSIGTQTLDVISQHPDKFVVEHLAAGTNDQLLLEQIKNYKPKAVSVADSATAERIKGQLVEEIPVYYGLEGVVEIAANSNADLVVSAMTGSQGMQPTLAAIQAGKDIALANKETLVSAGQIIQDEVRAHGVKMLPVDSEHSALFQCLNGEKIENVSKLILTASGGAFRDSRREELHQVTVEQALAHPNWSMGPKVTIDSATLANKGLEVIEAHWLFGIDYAQIEVVIHKESIIHSMVEYVDGSVIAQLGAPDMRVPIQYALTYPDRLNSNADRISFSEIAALHFSKADFTRFPCLKMAFEAGEIGGTATTVYNAANEVAVDHFLQRKIPFLEIEAMIYYALEQHDIIRNPSLSDILEIDRWARKIVVQK